MELKSNEMNKKVLFLIGIFLASLGLSSCRKCMTCEVEYQLPAGHEKRLTTPQFCGTKGELDEHEKQQEESYSMYDSLELDCTRE